MLDARQRWSQPEYARRRAALLSGHDSATAGAHERDWRGVDLRGVHLRSGLKPGVQLDFARLDGARIDSMDLSAASLRFVSAVESIWTAARLDDACLEFSNFAGASLSEGTLERASLIGTSFAGADLRASSLHSVVLRGCDLEGAWLWGATLPRTRRKSSWRRQHAEQGRYASFADVLEMGHFATANLSSVRVARALEGVAWAAPVLDLEIMAALHARDGESQMAAAGVAVFGTDRIRRPEKVVAMLWSALDRTSTWPFSQMAAACSLLDPHFVARARERLRTRTDLGAQQAFGVLTGGPSDALGAGAIVKWLRKAESWAGLAARSRWAPAPERMR